MREKDIEKWMRDQVSMIGGKFYKWVSPGNDGVPDRILILPGGRIIFVELKTETGRLSVVQSYVLGKLMRLGCETAVIYGMKDAKRFLEHLKGGNADEIRAARLSDAGNEDDHRE